MTLDRPLGQEPAVPPLDVAFGEHPPVPASAAAVQARFSIAGSLRRHAARGTLINAAFLVGLSGLGLVKGFVLAGFVSRADYGVWGILGASLGTLLWLRQVGIGDKYIQQDEADQEAAFQKAFTLELMFTSAFGLLLAALLPVFAAVYGIPELIAPGLVLIAALAAGVLQTPLWVFYRRMQFARQRSLQAVDPIVGFVVSIALAVAGAGYWALVLGVLVGSWASALAALVFAPYKLRLRYEPGTLRRYAGFSWPLFVSTGASVVMAQTAVLVAEGHLGVAAIGVIALAAAITSFTDRVDQLVTGTLYPAICAVKDQTSLLYESFVKSNRLALMWAVPFGIGLTLFCSDLVHLGIGERWEPAIVVLQIYGVAAALNHVGFNWDAYFRAHGKTRPMAVTSVAALIAFLAAGIPLLLAYGLPGFAAGVAIQGLVHLAFRAYYLQRLFEGFGFVRHAVRAFLPTLPAVAAVLLLRATGPDERTIELALGEAGVYLAMTAAATWYLESTLLREMAGYLRADPGAPAPALEAR